MKIKYGLWASCSEEQETIEVATKMLLGRIRRLENGVYTYKPTIRVGSSYDDFVYNRVTILVTYYTLKVPRILNRIYGKKNWQNKFGSLNIET